MDNEKIIRLGISLPKGLSDAFDEMSDRKGYQSRSEAIRDLIRKALVDDRWQDAEGEVAGTLTMVYDHHNRDLPSRLMDIQHEHHDLVITTQHVHLDHYNCLEVLVLRGPARDVEDLASHLVSCKGVKHGVFVPTMADTTLA